MRETLMPQNFADKEYCFIGADEEFERIELEGSDRPFFRKKSESSPDDDVVYNHLMTLAWRNQLRHIDEGGKKLLASEQNFRAQKLELGLQILGPAQKVAVADAGLSISAAHLGTILSALFGSMIVVSIMTKQWVIQPLIGWIGFVFGLTFIVMGLVSSKSGRKPA